jgi:hypothetical protein
VRRRVANRRRNAGLEPTEIVDATASARRWCGAMLR